MTSTPNPGSQEAVERGCTCPVIDNHYGRGVPYGKSKEALFWYSDECPLHGRKDPEPENCGAYSPKHCHSCTKAMTEGELV